MKKVVLALVAVASLVALVGCKKVKKSSGDGVAALKERGTFVLGLDASFPPMGFRDGNDEIVGYDIDLGREVAKRLGVEFKAQPIKWDAKDAELNSGAIDCIWNGFSINDERLAAFSFTEPYLNNAQVLVARTADGIKSLEDMAGKKIGIQAGSSAQDAVESVPEFAASLGEIVKFEENITALNDLDARGVDGVVMASVVASYFISQSGKPLELTVPLTSEAYGIAFRKTEPELRDAAWKALQDMAADGTIEAISKKWFGENISVIK